MCFYIHFSRAFKKYSFQICSFSHKKVVGYFRFFFTHSGPLTALYPTLCIKKNPSNIYLLKVTKYVGDSVKNVTARTKKIERRGASTPACLGLNVPIIYFKCSSMPDDDLGCSCSKNAVFLPKGLLFKLVEKTGRGYVHIPPPPPFIAIFTQLTKYFCIRFGEQVGCLVQGTFKILTLTGLTKKDETVKTT